MIFPVFIASLVALFLLRTTIHYLEFYRIPTNSKQGKNGSRWRSDLKRSLSIWAHLSSLSKQGKPNWRLGTETHGWKLAIVKGLQHFLSIFALVAAFFLALQTWLDDSTQIDFANSTVLTIERSLHWIKAVVKFFKIGFLPDVLILVLLILLAGFFPFVKELKLKSRYKNFNKIVTSILFFLTISTSFTFFGSRFAEHEAGREGELERHRLAIIEDNRLLMKRAEEEVVGRFADEILGQPGIQAILDQVRHARESIDESVSSLLYRDYFDLDSADLSIKAPVEALARELEQNFNFHSAFERMEYDFLAAYRSRGSGGKSSSLPPALPGSEEGSTGPWEAGHAQALSASSNRRTAGVLDATAASQRPLANFYSKFKEPICKAIKKAYKVSSEKWIEEFLESARIDFPFLSNLIDPIFHEPVKNIIIQTLEKVFTGSAKGELEEVRKSLESGTLDFRTTFSAALSGNERVKELSVACTGMTERTNEILKTAEGRITADLADAEMYLERLKKSSPLERIRQTFLRNLESGAYHRLPENGLKIATAGLYAWEAFLDRRKLALYRHRVADLEGLFISHLRNDPELLIVWGKCLLAFVEDPVLRTPYDALTYYFSRQGLSYDSFIAPLIGDPEFKKKLAATNEIFCPK